MAKASKKTLELEARIDRWLKRLLTGKIPFIELYPLTAKQQALIDGILANQKTRLRKLGAR